MKSGFNVLIIGAGQIGAFFDTPESVHVLTHAHAFTKHPGFNLVGFVDTEISKAQKAAALWGGEVFPDIETVFSKDKIDVVCVAVPDEKHYEVLKKLSRYELGLVLTEKPLTKTICQAEQIIKLYHSKRIASSVNYTRRFVPELEELKLEISNNSYGRYLTGTGYFGKGLVHNGSHLIDLLRYFVGEIKSVSVTNRIVDFYEDDPSLSAVLTFEDGAPFFLQSVDCRKFTIFEIDLLFEKNRVAIRDSGLKIEQFEIEQNGYFKGYRYIKKIREETTSIGKSLYYCANNIYEHLAEGKPLKYPVEEGYKTMETCNRILQDA